MDSSNIEDSDHETDTSVQAVGARSQFLSVVEVMNIFWKMGTVQNQKKLPWKLLFLFFWNFAKYKFKDPYPKKNSGNG